MNRTCCFHFTKTHDKHQHAWCIPRIIKLCILMNKHVILMLLLAFCLMSSAYSQKWKLTRYELHFGIGTTNVYSDIGGSIDKNNWWGIKDIRIKETRPSFYGGTRFKLKNNQSIKLNLILGFGTGSDVGSKNAIRNHSYTTTIFEPSVQYEYYFIAEDRRNRPSNLYNRSGMLNNFTNKGLYVFAGLGGVLFYPKYIQGTPIGTDIEIEAAKQQYPNEITSGYSHFSVVIPVGVGFKYSVDKYWSIGIEFGRRFSFSDFLDGFNAPAYSQSNDTYYFGVIHAIYKLKTDRKGVPAFLRRLGFKQL